MYLGSDTWEGNKPAIPFQIWNASPCKKYFFQFWNIRHGTEKYVRIVIELIKNVPEHKPNFVPTERSMPIAIYHFNVKIVSRSTGASCVTKAAYITGEKIKNERDGVTHDYRKKHEVVHKEILLPDRAPLEYMNRSVLWNAAERKET